MQHPTYNSLCTPETTAVQFFFRPPSSLLMSIHVTTGLFPGIFLPEKKCLMRFNFFDEQPTVYDPLFDFLPLNTYILNKTCYSNHHLHLKTFLFPGVAPPPALIQPVLLPTINQKPMQPCQPPPNHQNPDQATCVATCAMQNGREKSRILLLSNFPQYSSLYFLTSATSFCIPSEIEIRQR